MGRRRILVLMLVMCISVGKLRAQADELMQLALNIEKLAQFKQILTDLKNGYQIISKGYGTVKDIAEGNFSIHKTFLDALYVVSPEVRNYRRIVQIIQYQIILLKEADGALSYFKSRSVFRPQELEYLAQVYSRIIKASLRNIEELTMIITNGQLRMSDDERIKAIDAIYMDMKDKMDFVKNFNNEAKMLSLHRENIKGEVGNSKVLQGIK